MKQCLRDGTELDKKIWYSGMFNVMYRTYTGRVLLKVLTKPRVSDMAGRMLSAKASRVLVKPFVHSYKIDLSECEEEKYGSYNEFFSRRIRSEARPIDEDPKRLISPCDGQLLVLPITEGGQFMVKGSSYTMKSLLRNDELAAAYYNGQLLIFRLGVDDYHRYCFAVSGRKGESVSIPGVLHSVSPGVYDHCLVYKENSREYCVVQTEHFGDVLVMEVGALMVGKIVNHAVGEQVERGAEKGFFQFGGSTIILALKAGAAEVDADILRNSRNNCETLVKYGEGIGTALI